MADAATTEVECGFCLRKDSALEDPRCLPCAHVHCMTCLMDNYDINGLLGCPLCREVFDVALNTLPSSNTREHISTCCDSCTRKGEEDQPAVTYCTTCAAKYCSKHQKVHDDLHGGHPLLTMNEYRIQAGKLQPRLCSEHKELPYSLGCRSCLTVLCVKCKAKVLLCEDGEAHKLIPLSELVAALTSEIDGMRAEVTDREDKLSALFKKMSRIISDYDSETKDMITRLHKTCDEQVETIQLKYSKLEEELLELRGKAKADITRLMEEDVGVKWSNLGIHRLQIEARLKRNHQVDIVNGYEETTNEIKELMSDELPAPELNTIVALEVKDEQRVAEFEVVLRRGIIDIEHGLTTSQLHPKSMTILRTVKVYPRCSSVCHYMGSTYAGTRDGSIVRIDQNNPRIKSFVTLSNRVEGIAVYKDRIYTLVYGSPFTVKILDLTGTFITSWAHTDYGYFNKLCIVDNKIIIPDRQNQRLTLYSLNGEVITHLPCPLLRNSWVAMCAADNQSIVVTVKSSSQVFKVNISTGKVGWVSRHVPSPVGVTCYGSNVLVANESNIVKVWILDGKTGELLTEISDPTPRSDSHVFDLHISEKTLIVPRSSEMEVLFYRLD